MKPRECALCHKLFTPKSSRQLVCQDDHYFPCPDCGKLVEVKEKSYAMFLKTGPKRCKACARIAATKTMMSKTPEEKAQILEKRIQTNQARYGKAFAIQSDEVKQKREVSWIQKYGVVHPLKNADVKEKRERTVLAKYGVKNVLSSPDVRKKSIETQLHNYDKLNDCEDDQ